MARKQTITKQMIIDSALDLARREGIEAVTARKVAANAGCSTQPIFRIYENMDELVSEVIGLAGDYFAEFYEKAPKDSPIPFIDLGITYIEFAKKEEKLFSLLFVSHYKKNVSTYEFINGGSKMYVLKELKKINGVSAQKAGSIFSNFWIFVHGLACMVLNGDFDLSDEELKDTLIGIYENLKNGD